MVEVYKVVTRTNDPRVFLSSDVRPPIALSYVMQETTKSETPIFVFRELMRAVSYWAVGGGTFAGTDEESWAGDIIVGETSDHPFQIKDVAEIIPYPTFLTSQEQVKAFWREPEKLSWKQAMCSVYNSYGVYHFTPKRVLTKEDIANVF